MTDLICSLASICTIAYGGFVDYKKREIPDIVPVTLILASLPKGYLPERLIAMILAALILLLAEKISGQELPGGDLKLICSVIFANGPFEALAILIFAGLAAMLVSLAKKQLLKRHIPLCTYAAPAFILLEAAKLI